MQDATGGAQLRAHGDRELGPPLPEGDQLDTEVVQERDAASLAVGKMARISSPIVLMTLPRLRSVAARMSPTQATIMSRAR